MGIDSSVLLRDWALINYVRLNNCWAAALATPLTPDPSLHAPKVLDHGRGAGVPSFREGAASAMPAGKLLGLGRTVPSMGPGVNKAEKGETSPRAQCSGIH